MATKLLRLVNDKKKSDQDVNSKSFVYLNLSTVLKIANASDNRFENLLNVYKI